MSGDNAAQHVLVIGIDGVRWDVLTEVETPALDQLAAEGFALPVRVDDRNPTISGPVWSTVASGVYSDQHLIRGNDLHGHALADHPDFLTVVAAADDDVAPAAFASWPQLVSEEAGGPIFAGGGFCPADAVEIDESKMALSQLADEAVTGRAARHLLRADARLTFSYLGHVDAVGHHEGVTGNYRAAVARADEQVDVLLAAIEARPQRASEQWTIIAVTDHGHLDAGGHGGDSDLERGAWIIASGGGLAGVTVADHADIHPQVLSRFGVTPSEHVQGRAWV